MDDWMTAREALSAIEAIGYRQGAGQVIARRAHSGLVMARAQRLSWGAQSRDDAAIDKSFWWAEGGAYMQCDWRVGDFSTVISAKHDPNSVWSRLNRDVRVRADGVMFERSGIEAMLPPVEQTGARDGKSDVAEADLKRFYSLFAELYRKGGNQNPSEEATIAAAKAFFPRNHITRERIRALRGAQPMGRPAKVAE